MTRFDDRQDDRKWIELIRVRSSAQALAAALEALRAQVDEISATTGSAVETFFLQHGLYDGDLAVVVIWRDETAPRETREGLMIAESLRRLGSVDHAVWVPTTS